ncbi:unnamed protein product [Calypogeia fissa]
MATIKLMTYNFQGLATRLRRLKAKNSLWGLPSLLDILCLQEHKLRQGKIDKLQFEIWPETHFIVAPALDGAHARRNGDVYSGKGGLAFVLPPS